jgi:hypothetical protein
MVSEQLLIKCRFRYNGPIKSSLKGIRKFHNFYDNHGVLIH